MEDTDAMVDILAPSGPSHIALSLIKTRPCGRPLRSLPPSAKRNECRYFVSSKGYEHLYTHPPPDSLAANQRERQGYQGPSPKNQEAEKLDLFDRKVYLMAGGGRLQLRISNQEAILSRYNYNSYGAMAEFMELLPQDSGAEFSMLVKEGKLIAQASLQAALDIADAVTRIMAMGVAMRRSSWLQVSGLPCEVQKIIQDLPFEGSALCSEKILKAP